MTLEEKLQQIALLPDFKVAGEAGEEEARNGLGSVLSLTDPARIRRLQEIAVEESRLGIPILFAFDTIHGYRTVFPIPLGTGASFDPKMAAADAELRRPRVDRGRPQADLRPDGRRLARAALGPHLRGRRRGPLPELGDGRRTRQGDAGRRLQRERQADRQPQALRRIRRAGGRVATTRRPTCPSSGCGTSTCRRSRRRSMPAPTRSCARSTRSTASPGCGNELPDERGPQGPAGTSTASSRATGRRSPSCGPARRRTRTTGECGHGVAADGPSRGRARAQLGRRLGDDERP